VLVGARDEVRTRSSGVAGGGVSPTKMLVSGKGNHPQMAELFSLVKYLMIYPDVCGLDQLDLNISWWYTTIFVG
jgi:hypothetical protein